MPKLHAVIFGQWSKVMREAGTQPPNIRAMVHAACERLQLGSIHCPTLGYKASKREAARSRSIRIIRGQVMREADLTLLRKTLTEPEDTRHSPPS